MRGNELGFAVLEKAIKPLLNKNGWLTRTGHVDLYEAIVQEAERQHAANPSIALEARRQAVLLLHRGIFRGRLSRDSPDDDILEWDRSYNLRHADIVNAWDRVRNLMTHA